MSTYDDRLAALERKVAMLELRRVHDERMAEESAPPALTLNLKEINENMTILLGIIAKQEESTEELKESMGRVEHRFDGFDRRIEDLDGRLITFEHNVNSRFEAQNQRMTSFEQNVNNRFEAQNQRLISVEQHLTSFEQSVNSRFEVADKKQDQVLSMLSTLTSKPQQET